ATADVPEEQRNSDRNEGERGPAVDQAKDSQEELEKTDESEAEGEDGDSSQGVDWKRKVRRESGGGEEPEDQKNTVRKEAIEHERERGTGEKGEEDQQENDRAG